MMKPKRNRYSGANDEFVPQLVVKCVEGAIMKCDCGATLKNKIDVQLHFCHRYATARQKDTKVWEPPWA